MAALAIHGYEPVSLRYFKLCPDGTLHYLDEAEIATLERDKAAKGEDKTKASLSIFADMELQFRKVGDPNRPSRSCVTSPSTWTTGTWPPTRRS